MNIARAILHIQPKADVMKDYVVRDDGPTPVLRPGVDGLFRFQIRPMREGETEEVEGIHYHYATDYNRLTLGVDYDLAERGPYIAVWNLPEPQPTEEELQHAWNAIKDLPEEPKPLTEAERIRQLEAENKLLAERAEFIEDLIAEMAMKVYP
ncbi:XkdW family protein [Paenibacillus mesotrionivorans]|uniref:XkdW family protein n=1 Tax=Paenibacillus mesotrionivorans TaxID=3160968 RepID=A0ACC7NW57_9BACL